jgi:hypothetical protein
MQALNKVVAHVGVESTDVSFSRETIEKISGFQGNYDRSLDTDDLEAARTLAQFYEVPNRDLQTLMDNHFPSASFHGFESELGL